MPYPPPGHYFRSQLWTKLPMPSKSFEGKTVIVTGSSAGLGMEATRHIVRLGAAKVIMAVRNVEKGEKVARDIERTTERAGVLGVWELDQARYESVRAFARRCQTLDRIDVVLANAGVHSQDWTMAEDYEVTITVNVVSTLLLAVLLIDKLRSTANKTGSDVVLTFVGSFLHWMADFKQAEADKMLPLMADLTKSPIGDLYPVSKLMLLFATRQLAKETAQPRDSRIIISVINPGSVHSNMSSDNRDLTVRIIRPFVFRSTEEGSRTLVHGAEGQRDTHGQYLCDCKPAPPELVSPFARGDEGYALQEKFWRELLDKLEEISPGSTRSIKSSA